MACGNDVRMEGRNTSVLGAAAETFTNFSMLWPRESTVGGPALRLNDVVGCTVRSVRCCLTFGGIASCDLRCLFVNLREHEV